jgi:hypothetical protein
VIVWVVVLTRAVVYLPARVATLDLNRRMPYGKAPAKPPLEASNDMLCLTERTIVHHHVNAERHLLR